MEILRGLRSRGFCVVVWTPNELGFASADDLEDAVTSYGNDMRDYLNEDPI